MTRWAPPREDSLRIGPVLVLALGLIGALFWKYRNLGGSGDEVAILEQARQLIPYHWVYGPVHPGLIRLLTVFRLSFFDAGKLVSAVSAVLMLVCSYAAFKRLFDPTRAAVMTLLVLLHPTFLQYAVVPNNYMLAAFFTVLITLLLLDTDSYGFREWLLIGLLIGATYLARAAIVSLCASGVVLIVVFGRERRAIKVLGLALGFLAPAVAWQVLNRALSGASGSTAGWGMLSYYALVSRKWDSYIGMHEFRLHFESLSLAAQAVFLAKLLPKVLLTRVGEFPAYLWGFAPILGSLFIPGFVFRLPNITRREVAFIVCLLPLLIAPLMTIEPGWGYYYIQVYPLLAAAGVAFVGDFAGAFRFLANKRALLVGLLVLVQGAWCLSQYPGIAADLNWVELERVNNFLRADHAEHATVACTAKSIRYQQPYGFVPLDYIPVHKDAQELVDFLREKKVDYLVFLERHSLFCYPALDYLLTPGDPRVPKSLQLVFFVDQPRRAAVYRFNGAPP